MILDTPFTKTSQELIQFVTELRGLGAQVYLDLPRIVVIGNQSAGKSSLVEAISGISVPRDAGTCTRCPMECRLAHFPGTWSCQISIRWEYDAAGERLDEVEEVPFGARLTNPADVELMLRRAQAAVLGVSAAGGRAAAVTRFVGMSAEEMRRSTDPSAGGTKALAFSRNTICVDIKGPELVDLSFVDLPGIVQNAEAEIVKLVEDLVTSYVQGNCLILVALPMSDDIENQKAARIAKLADSQGLRTIGVLTKPDTIPAGSTKRREQWLDVLEGRAPPEHALRHGYFCTRQPDDDQRLAGITPGAARAAEAEFFRTTAPWGSSTCPRRFGTGNLVKSISELLTRIISDSLPKLLGEVAAQLTATKKQLAQLPPAVTTEPSAFVLDLVTRFQHDVSELVHGSPRRASLVQATRETYERFKYAIRDTAPAFVPFEDAQRAPKSRMRFVRMEDEDEDGRPAGVGKGAEYQYLEDVREHIRASVTRKLPNNIPYPAKRSLIESFQKKWEEHFMACFERVQAAFKEHLQELMKQRFDRFGHLKGVIICVRPSISGVFTAETCADAPSRPNVMEQVNICAAETVAQLQIQLQLERAAPFTQNTHYLASKRTMQLAQYKQARASRSQNQAPNGKSSDESDSGSAYEQATLGGGKTNGSNGKNGSSPAVPRSPKTLNQKEKETLSEALAALVKLGYSVGEDDLGKLNPPDTYEEELEVMAEVRAYFQVAYKRVIDYTPLLIDLHLLYKLEERLQGVLIERLGLGSAKADARCAAYIAEDPHVSALRSELLAKRAKLEKVQRALYDFGL
ncbi:P-loop containing nucleoside triphosphate hydrolase protein [Trametes polyzona]|nr:P-loop containing nucleoside triphosphate hydrolase protein [Trametes polyzona]